MNKKREFLICIGETNQIIGRASVPPNVNRVIATYFEVSSVRILKHDGGEDITKWWHERNPARFLKVVLSLVKS